MPSTEKDYASGKLAGEMEMRERCVKVMREFLEEWLIAGDVSPADAKHITRVAVDYIAQAIASLPPSQTRTETE